MEYEEDPNSQYIDYTNVTDLEILTSDIEKCLIKWNLNDKGSVPSSLLQNDLNPIQYYQELIYNKTKFYIYLINNNNNDHTMNHKKQLKWNNECINFTPTMLALNNTSNDFNQINNIQYNNVYVPLKNNILINNENEISFNKNIQRWFGINEYLFLSKEFCLKNDHLNDNNINININDHSFDKSIYSILLSSITCALVNINCTIPIFIPIKKSISISYIGTAVPGMNYTGGHAFIKFETDSVPELKTNQSCISGLMDFFRLKLQLPYEIEEKINLFLPDLQGDPIQDEQKTKNPNMTIAVSFVYEWKPELVKLPDDFKSCRNENDVGLVKSDNECLTSRDKNYMKTPCTILLRNGKERLQDNPDCTETLLEKIGLECVWPLLQEGSYIDNVVHSELEPKNAPNWFIQCYFKNDENNVSSNNKKKKLLPMASILQKLISSLIQTKDLSKNILVSEIAPYYNNKNQNYTSSNSTSPKKGTRRTYASGSKSDYNNEQKSTEITNPSLIGSITQTIVYAASWKGSDFAEVNDIYQELFDNNDGNSKHVKNKLNHTAPPGELLSLLSFRMAELSGINSMCLLWVEFVKGLRAQWDAAELLPRMGIGESGDKYFISPMEESYDHYMDHIELPNPDFNQSILQQRLQLLNCCILRRHRLRIDEQSTQLTATKDIIKTDPNSEKPKINKGWNEDDIDNIVFSDDEYNEANVIDHPNDVGDDEEGYYDSLDKVPSKTSAEIDKSKIKRKGAFKVIPNMFSLKKSVQSSEIFEPFLQDHLPLTEEMARDKEEVLTKLGHSKEDLKIRQQFQTMSLISDMKAFKAANPGCCLADFIRWHSPKDWIPWLRLSEDDIKSLKLIKENETISLASDHLDTELEWYWENVGILSERMRTKNRDGGLNLWQITWNDAIALSAKDQIPIFNASKEAEKVFHSLETLRTTEMFAHLIVPLIETILYIYNTKIHDPIHMNVHNKKPTDSIPNSDQTSVIQNNIIQEKMLQVNVLAKEAIHRLDEYILVSLNNNRNTDHNTTKQPTGIDLDNETSVILAMAIDSLEKLVTECDMLEEMITFSSNIMNILCKAKNKALNMTGNMMLKSFINRLVDNSIRQNKKTNVSNDFEKNIISDLFFNSSDNEIDIIKPIHREYILRYIGPRPFYNKKNQFNNINNKMYDVNENIDDIITEEEIIMDESFIISRMYAGFDKETVRFALALSDSDF